MNDPQPVGSTPVLADLQDRLAAKGVKPYRGEYPRTETAQEKLDRLAAAHAAAESRWKARLPVMYSTADMADLTPEQSAAELAAWVANPDAVNLILAGTVGAGKTHAAYALGNLLIARHRTVEAWTVHDLLEALRPNGVGAERAGSVDVLILDDLAQTPGTSEWPAETITALLDQRLRDLRRTIITTNLPEDKIRAAWGDRFADRLRYQATVVIMRGQSRRTSAW